MGRRGRYARLEQDPKLHQPGGPPIPISERVYPGYVEVGDDCLDDCHGKLPTRTAGREVRAVEPLGQALEQELAVLPRRAQVPPDSNRMGRDLPRYHSLVELEVGQDEAVVVLDRRSAHRWRRARDQLLLDLVVGGDDIVDLTAQVLTRRRQVEIPLDSPPGFLLREGVALDRGGRERSLGEVDDVHLPGYLGVE